MNVFELFASLTLKSEKFTQDLAAAGNDLKLFGQKISAVINTLKKIDDVILKIGKTVLSTTSKIVSETFSIAKSIDENITEVVNAASQTFITAFRNMASEGVSFFKDVFEEGMQFDSAMGQVSATMLRSREEFDSTQVSVDGFNGSLREFAKKLGAETRFTATQAAEGLQYMALAGYDAQTSAEMLPKVLELATAGAMDLGLASDMITDSQTALGLSLEDTTNLINQMAKTASSSNTSVSQLGDAILSIGATARQLKGGYTELNTTLGLLADNGIKASEGGNMLRRILVALTSPTNEAKEAFNKLNVSAYDSNGSLKSLKDIFLELGEALNEYTAQDKADIISTIFSQYSLAGVNSLLGTTSERWETLENKIKDCENAASSMANIQLQTLPGQVTILQSAFSGLKDELYEKGAPIAQKFIESLSSGLSVATTEVRNGEFSEAFSTIGDTVADLIIKGARTFLESESAITEFLNGIVTLVDKVGNALFNVINDTLPTFVRLLTNAATDIISNLAEFLGKPENISALKVTIQDFFDTLKTFFRENEDDLYIIFSTLFDLAIEFVDEIFSLKRETIYSILWRKLTEIVDDLSKNINTYLKNENLQQTVDSLLEFIGNIVNLITENAPIIVPKILTFLLGIAGKAIDGLSEYLSNNENVEKIRATIQNVINQLTYFLKEHSEDFVKILETLIDLSIQFLPQIFKLKRETTVNVIKQAINNIFTGALMNTFLEDIVKTFIVKPAFAGLEEGISDPPFSIGEAILKLVDTILGFFLKGFEIHSPSQLMKREVGENIAAGLGEGISERMEIVKEKIKNIIESVKGLFTNFDFESIRNTGENIITGLWEGISNARNWLEERINGFTETVTEWFRDFWGIHSPSKVMENDVGKYLAQGVGTGFIKNIDQVKKDIEDSLPSAFDLNSKILNNLSPTSDISPIQLNINIDNFNNNTEEDINDLGNRLSYVLRSQILREKAVVT